jgi:hypothetical protein
MGVGSKIASKAEPLTRKSPLECWDSKPGRSVRRGMSPIRVMLTTAELEARMRPGASSEAGFLGPRESLLKVLRQDDQAVVSLGLTHKQLAEALEDVLKRGRRHQTVRIRTPSSNPQAHDGRGLEIEIVSWLGCQNCPWPTCFSPSGIWGANWDWVIRRPGSGQQVAGPGLIVHLIKEHSFYEGLRSPYRVDPVALATILGLV